jgi:hypothetical protein
MALFQIELTEAGKQLKRIADLLEMYMDKVCNIRLEMPKDLDPKIKPEAAYYTDEDALRQRIEDFAKGRKPGEPLDEEEEPE